MALWLDNLLPFVAAPKSIDLPVEFEERLTKIERQVARRVSKHGSAQAKLDHKAALFGTRAIAAAKSGRLTEAETLFAASLELKDDPDIAFAYGLFLGQIHPTTQTPERYDSFFKEIDTQLRKSKTDEPDAESLLSALIESGDIRNLFDTPTNKIVLILGRFTTERKRVLDSLRTELRERGYLPILFDSEKPSSRDLTETISTLAHLSRFVIADITDARSIPQELARIVPALPSVPVQPMIQSSTIEYAMFEHFKVYPWVMETHIYSTPADAVAAIPETIIDQVEARIATMRDRPI